jgi:recombination protein RecA
MAENKAEKFKNIATLSKLLDKQHDTVNSLVRLGSKNITTIPSIPTGLPTFDYYALQFGGIPRGRIIELFGAESAGKTTTALHIVAQEQGLGGITAFVDAEHALDPTYAEALGVNIDDLIINQPNSGEQALQTVDALVTAGDVSLIVVDSVAALVPEAELAGEIGDAHVGLQARMMSQAMRILVGKCSKNMISVIFLNQLREKIGVMYGNPETTPGGRALKFAASSRIKVRRGEAIWEGTKENIVGHRLIMRIEKNKGGIPFRTAELDLLYPKAGRQPGFDKVSDTIAYAAKHGLFESRGSWYWMDGERIANGLDNLKETLRNSPEVITKLQKKIKEYVKTLAEEPVGSAPALPMEKL